MSSGVKRILLMTAHPDDADIMAGGAVARWVHEGHEVQAVLFTRGDKGHDDPAMTSEAVATLREVEQRAAATILGVPQSTFLDFSDGELAWTGPQFAWRTRTYWNCCHRRLRTDRIAPHVDGVTHYDSRSDRSFASSLSCRTTSVVWRMSASLRPTPIVDAIARNRAFKSR